MLYSCFDLYPKSVDTILKETSLDIMKVNQLIAELLLEGDIKEVSKNCYVRVDVEDLFNG
jgi:DNA processing protein